MKKDDINEWTKLEWSELDMRYLLQTTTCMYVCVCVYVRVCDRDILFTHRMQRHSKIVCELELIMCCNLW